MSLDVRRSHRRGLLEMVILPLLLLRPFRCEDCTKRHYNLFFTRAFQEPGERFTAMPEERRMQPLLRMDEVR